ncbi:MAG: methyltransferase domain-containing protein [Anaerolineae bacterium]|nr:methyltransferase domain-containing protein [Anaerolineae bacterium]
MLSGRMVEAYSDFEAWLHDFFVAERALNLHRYIFQETKLSDVFAEKKERRVLDVGCGGGQAAIWLKGLYPHLEMTGIDLSEPQIERARVRARQKGCAVQFEVANAQALPFPDGHFDIVYSLGSVKHWPNPLQGVSECWRVLKPGGELLLMDSTSDATHEQIVSFYRIAGFPKLLERPVVAAITRIIFRASRPMAVYRDVADQLKMPPGTVGFAPELPSFLFRTRKP